MSGLEAAIVGAVSNVVTKEAVNWIRGRGPDFTEADWEKTGEPILRQVRATHEQFRTGYANETERKALKNEIRISGRALRELKYVGEERDFNKEMVGLYGDLADLMAEWQTSAEIDLEDEAGSYAERFEELYREYQESK